MDILTSAPSVSWGHVAHSTWIVLRIVHALVSCSRNSPIYALYCTYPVYHRFHAGRLALAWLPLMCFFGLLLLPYEKLTVAL